MTVQQYIKRENIMDILLCLAVILFCIVAGVFLVSQNK